MDYVIIRYERNERRYRRLASPIAFACFTGSLLMLLAGCMAGKYPTATVLRSFRSEIRSPAA